MVKIEAGRSALLVMDYQADIIARVGDRLGAALERTKEVIAGARAAQIPVMYVVVGFRPGYPEVSPNNAAFAVVTATGRFQSGTPGADIAPELRPEPSDIVVVKHRTGAFTGTDLDMILRAKHIDTLVLCGLVTSGVVLSTVRSGADSDYRLIVLKDCCADLDDEVHAVLTEKVFARQATVVSAEQLLAAL